MQITSRNLAKSLVGMIADRGRDPKEAVRQFVAFVQRHRLASLLPNVERHLIAAATAERNRGTMRIAAAGVLSPETARNIAKTLNIPTDAVVEIHTEEHLLGGFVASYGGFVYDASVRRQLERLRKQLAYNG